ncbi:MAG: hypothetical protein ACKOAD_06940 [Gammaproteobacteria bacterium]
MGILKSGAQKTGRALVWLFEFKPKQWFLVEDIKKHGQEVYQAGRELLKTQQAQRNESFEEALMRLEISEQQLNDMLMVFRNFFIFYFLFSLALFSYGMWLAFNANMPGFFMSLASCFLSASFAFRYHFWLFQLKQRKLGCNLKDWWNYVW